MRKKKINGIFIFLAILLLFIFAINDNKIYTIKENELRNKNEEILKKENIENFSLVEDKKINYNRIYLYKIDERSFYMFIYTKSLIFDLFHLDDGLKVDDKEINTLASNIKYNNLISLKQGKNDKIEIKTIKNEDTKNNILLILSISILVAFINYIKNKR